MKISRDEFLTYVDVVYDWIQSIKVTIPELSIYCWYGKPYADGSIRFRKRRNEYYGIFQVESPSPYSSNTKGYCISMCDDIDTFKTVLCKHNDSNIILPDEFIPILNKAKLKKFLNENN